jgi:hypothetical protein
MGRGKSASGERVMHFSIEEAEKVLPKVERLVRKGQRIRDKLAWLLETHEGVLEVSSDDGFHYFLTEQVRANKEFHRLYFQFYKTVEELQEIGVIVRDIDDGLIDFPFKMKGTDAFLSWQLGEDKIRHWHDGESGFEGRRPIVDLDELFQKKDL